MKNLFHEGMTAYATQTVIEFTTPDGIVRYERKDENWPWVRVK